MGKRKKNNAKKELAQAVPVRQANSLPDPPRSGGRTGMVLALIALLILVAGAVYFFRRQLGLVESLRAGEFKDYNVLFVTLDTTRADRLPAYGYTGVATPNFDALAKESYVFEDAISQVPLTLPSHTSMMTGKLPIGHGVRDNSGFFLDQKETTLAESFKQAGYVTSAFVSAFVLDSRWQLNQGFDLYFDNFNLAQFQDLNPRDVQRRGEETEIEASHWLEENKDHKFFSWVHFYDPHDPYDPPEPYHTQYADKPYNGEIAYMDDVFGRLMKKLRELGLQDRTVIVIAGDHGEGLGEHEEAAHAMFLYNTTQHVPLFLHAPGGGEGRVPGVVSLIDIAPTLLDLAGLPPVPEMQGSSLLSKINGADSRSRAAYSESIYAEVHYGWSPLEAITTDEYKYIKAPKEELYDRKNDRNETRNLMKEKASYAKVLQNDLQDLITKYAAKNLSGPQKMDAETEERLRALGYVGSTATSTPESRMIDPKDKIQLARGIQLAFDSLETKHYNKALEEITPVLREDPTMVDAHFVAGVANIGLEKYDAAIDELMRTISFRPDHTMALYNLGFTYELKGDLKEAEHWYQKVLQYESKHLFTMLRLAHVYRELNQPERARQYFLATVSSYERALQATKGEKAKAALYSTLGELYFGAGDLSKAELNYRSAILLAPDHDSFHYNLAQIFEATGNIPAAVDAYREEIRIDPKSFKSFNNLGLIYKNINRLEDASLCFQKVIELDPQDPRGYLLLSGTYRKMGREQDAGAIIRTAQQRGIPID